MANMQIDELGTLNLTLGKYIRNRYGLSKNKAWLDSGEGEPYYGRFD